MTARFAWRLVRPLQSFAYGSVISSMAGGKYHEAGDRVMYGWSSSEMAFMSMLIATGGHAPLQLVREKLRLPPTAGRIESLSACLASGAIPAAEVDPLSQLCGAMKRRGLLGVWVESELMPSEHVLVLNPDAPSFAEVSVASSSIVSRGELF